MGHHSFVLTDTDTQQLVDRLWGPATLTTPTLSRAVAYADPILQCVAYRDYYRRRWTRLSRQDSGRRMALRSPHALNDFVAQLAASGGSQTLPELFEILKEANPDASDEACSNSLNLALGLLLMYSFGPVRGEQLPFRYLNWVGGSSLRDFVKLSIEQQPKLAYEHIRLPKHFNAWSLESISGIKIEFTDNLADHLLLVDDDKTVLVFHHVTFLQNQGAGPRILPEAFVDETIRTLVMLFPMSELGSRPVENSAIIRTKRRWFGRLIDADRSRIVDSNLARCGTLLAEERQIECFRFWRDRLVILKQAYDDSTPSTLSQWWYDHREGSHWYSFWAAIIVVSLMVLVGVAQCVELWFQLSHS